MTMSQICICGIDEAGVLKGFPDGGAGQVDSMSHALDLAQARDDVTLTIAGRQPALALVVSVRNSEIVLTGNGPYPAVAVQQ